MQRICDNDDNGTFQSCWVIAIYGDVSNLNPGASTVAFYILNTIEVMAFITLFCAVPVVLPVLWKSNSFHLNMMRFLVFFIAQSYIYITSRAVLYIFQIGIVKIANKTESPLDYVLIGATIARYYQMASCVFIFGAINCIDILFHVIERVCATVYIQDYERQRRSWISTILIVGVIVLCLLQSVGITYSISKYFRFFLLGLNVIIAEVCGSMCVWIFVYNNRRLNKLKNASDKYTLSLKYQLIENIRSFRFIRNIAIIGTAGIVICITPLAVGIVYLSILNTRVLSGQTFETINALFITIGVCGLPFLVPSWRNEVARRTRFLRWFIRESPLRDVTDPHANESDTYFDDLHSVWNTKLEAKINPKRKINK